MQKFHFKQVSPWEATLCLRFNRASHFKIIKAFFKLISRLGDGVFWYSLMSILLIVDGKSALLPVIHMALTGLTCTLVYKFLKAKTLRPRPYQINHQIIMGTAPLDQFSFPSGHTLHAVAFTIVLLAYYPHLEWLVVSFAALVALSRLVLGLHYPTDVIAGALIGTTIASTSLWMW